MFERLFRLSQHHTSIKQEFIAGVTTFVTMAYIVIVAPSVLHQAGMPLSAAFLATCLLCITATTVSAFLSNYPIAFGPGLGLLSYFAYVVAGQLGYSWQSALGAVFLAGVVFFLLTVSSLRRLILEAIPHSLGCAIAGGIGFFIGFIALKNIGLIVSNPNTLLTLGPINSLPMVLFFVGFVLIAIFENRKIPGGILLSMLIVTVIGLAIKHTHYQGIFAWPHFSDKAIWAFNLKDLWHIKALPVLFTFLIVALFDSTGTLLSLTHYLQEGPKPDQLKRMNRALFAESAATTFSGIIGCSTASPFIESSAGIRAGGRTGLTAITVALCFVLALFFLPLAKTIPDYATSAALFYVATLMIQPFAKVNWTDSSDFIPATITLFTIPLTFSIADGIGLGLICYVVLKLAKGEWRKLPWVLVLLVAMFMVFFAIK